MRTVIMLAMLHDLPPVTQSTAENCGPACLTAVLRYYGVTAFEGPMAVRVETSPLGTQPAAMLRAANESGFRAHARSGRTLRGLRKHLGQGRPIIVLIRSTGGESHYVVVVGMDDEDVSYMDPWTGRIARRPRGDFLARWIDGGEAGMWSRWGLVIWRD